MASKHVVWVMSTVLQCILYALVKTKQLNNRTQQGIPVEIFCQNNSGVVCAMMYKFSASCTSFKIGRLTITLTDTGREKTSSTIQHKGKEVKTANNIDIQDKRDCPDQWIKYHASCYHLFQNPQEWAQANSTCANHHDGHLVTIENRDENTFLRILVQNTQLHHTDVWIDANDQMSKSDFRWVANNHKVTFTDWAPGQPDDKHGNEKCVHLRWHYHLKWNDAPCSFQNHYICETRSNVDPVG